jgi:hypothetical protein
MFRFQPRRAGAQQAPEQKRIQVQTAAPAANQAIQSGDGKKKRKRH